ncbi:3'-5' exoribonuclease YhaM family protein [Clostridium sp. WILCCON 0269]|uniref:3'-5' exoribonuclease YhaM family protein n=1 Tax=Candidatus Clostridium eludens TaxID=3381663 RepID=A0ABW8SMF6_9CLOT
MKIKDLIHNKPNDIFLMVNEIEEGVTSNNSPYIKFTFTDGKDSIKGIMWDKSIADISPISSGSLIKIRAIPKTYRSALQLTVSQCRLTTKDDTVSIEDFVKTSPVKPIDIYNELVTEVSHFKNENFKKVVVKLLEDNKDKLLYYPAAKVVHHAIQGGLLYHIYRMYKSGLALADIYEYEINKELFISGIILHDIGKLNELSSNTYGVVEDYSTEGKLLGHIVQGVIMLHDAARELNIAMEDELVLKHMLISHHGSEENGSPRKPMILEAQLLNKIDEIDAIIYQFQDTLGDLEKGTFSENKFFLKNIQIYKHY